MVALHVLCRRREGEQSTNNNPYVSDKCFDSLNHIAQYSYRAAAAEYIVNGNFAVRLHVPDASGMGGGWG